LKFSLLISVYDKEKPFFLQQALDSIICQTLLPDEVVIVKDGPIKQELNNIIDNFKNIFQNEVIIINLDKNYGLGYALSVGIQKCNYDIVARMDSDDISFPNRFSKQINEFVNDDLLDVLGTALEEFLEFPNDYKILKIQPAKHIDIYNKSKYLNPISHPTVMFRKSKVLACGSYQDMPFFEDYFLWIRMLSMGCRFSNLNDILLYFRIGNGMINRRHGFSYFKHEIIFYYQIFKIKYISLSQFIYIIIAKSIIRLSPIFITKLFYKKFVRNSI
jgi:glycosyltransferase involved in cell wall biosynthesis